MTRLRLTLMLLLATLSLAPAAARAGSRTPARTAQITETPQEPPLVEGTPPPLPPGLDPGAPPALPAQEGTLCPVDPPTPRVSIRVRVAANAAVGQDLTYRICVNNPTRAPAHNVTVRAPLPATATFVRATPETILRGTEMTWRLGTLAGGACRELVLVLRPTGGDVSCCARVSFEHGQCVVTRVGGRTPIPGQPVPGQPMPGPSDPGLPPVPTTPPPETATLTIRKTAPPQVALNEAITFRIELSNPGTTPLTDVSVTDILPRQLRFVEANPEPDDRRALLRWTIGTLNAGQSRVIEYRALALQEGDFSNRAVATATGGIRQESISRVRVGQPRLSLNMVGPEKRYANLPAVYELTVSNPGSAPVANVLISNPLPADTRFVSASDGGTLIDNEVRWALGTMAPGARRTLKLQLAAQKPGEVLNQATARGDGDISTRAELKTRFEGVAALTARLADRDPLEIGQEGEYVLVIRNSGTDSAANVRVVATIPTQLQATDAQGPAKFALDAARVAFEPVTLEAGKELRYTFYVKAVKAGDVRFRVEIASDVLTAGPLLEEESTTIFEDR